MKQQSKTGLGLMFVAVAAVAFGGSFAAINPTTTVQHDSMDTSFIKGHVELVQRDGEGNIKAYSQSDNVITRTGLGMLANQFFGANATETVDAAPTHIGLGTGAVGDETDNALTTEVTACDRIAITSFTEDALGTPANNLVTLTATFDAGADAGCIDGPYIEAGLFNQITTGDMFATNGFTGVTLAGTDTLDITWTFGFTDS